MKNLIILLLAASGFCASARDLELPRSVVVFKAGENSVKQFRIPSLACTQKGTLLALADARVDRAGDIPNNVDLALKRSEDNGKTWSPLNIIADYETPTGACDAAMMVDRNTGRIWCLYTVGYGVGIRQSQPGLSGKTCQIHAITSDDDGVIWSKPRDITPMIKDPDMKFIGTAPGVGIQLMDGTFVFAIYTTAVDSGMVASLIYSTDSGKTWERSQPWGAVNGNPATTETQLVQLPEGSLLVNSRNHYKKGCRATAVSKDLGQTWSELGFDATLTCPTCMASLIAIKDPRENNKQLLVFANPNSKKGRKDGTVRISEDNGQSWKWSKLIKPGAYAYSCLTQLQDGSIGLFYEAGNGELRYMNLSLPYITDGDIK
jgi:sialidase-1